MGQELKPFYASHVKLKYIALKIKIFENKKVLNS